MSIIFFLSDLNKFIFVFYSQLEFDRIVILQLLPKAGLGNVRPAGHMWPAKHLYVAREHFLGSGYVKTTWKIPPKTLYFKKMDC